MQNYRFQVLVERDEDGCFIACVPELECCHTQGRTAAEAVANIREVVVMCLQEMAEDGCPFEGCKHELVAIETIEVEG